VLTAPWLLSEGAFLGPVLQSIGETAAREPKTFCPSAEAFGLLSKCEEAQILAISLLLERQHPSDISRHVAAIVVDPIDLISRSWSPADSVQKNFEIFSPWPIKTNSTSSVALEVFAIWVRTSVDD
jgi:hypothetical protein